MAGTSIKKKKKNRGINQYLYKKKRLDNLVHLDYFVLFGSLGPFGLLRTNFNLFGLFRSTSFYSFYFGALT